MQRPFSIIGSLLLILVLCSCSHFNREAGFPSPGTAEFVDEVVGSAEELLAAVKRLGDASNGTIILRPGYYRLTEPIRLTGKRQVVIAGSGWNTVLVQSGSCDGIVFEDCHFCWVQDLVIEFHGRGATGSGILFTGSCSSNAVSCCRITGFPESGIRFDGGCEAPMSSNTVRDCHFIANRGTQLASLCNNDFFFLGNQFGTHGLPYEPRPKFGCVLDHSSAGTYTMNYHWGNVTALQVGPGANFNRIENNRVEESSEAGLRIGAENGEPCWENIVIGNTIHTNSESGIGKYNAVEAYNAGDVIFSHNQVFSWDANTTKHRTGLYLGPGCRSWIITDNVFRHHTEQAIDFADSGGHIVERNITD